MISFSKPVENFYKNLFGPKLVTYAVEQDLRCSPLNDFLNNIFFSLT